MALGAATSEAIWLRLLLKDLGYEQYLPTKIHEDNQGSIALCKNTKNHTKVKHIGIQYHFTRERVASKEIELPFTPSSEMMADIFTKPVTKPIFLKIIQQLKLDSTDSSSESANSSSDTTLNLSGSIEEITCRSCLHAIQAGKLGQGTSRGYRVKRCL